MPISVNPGTHGLKEILFGPYWHYEGEVGRTGRSGRRGISRKRRTVTASAVPKARNILAVFFGRLFRRRRNRLNETARCVCLDESQADERGEQWRGIEWRSCAFNRFLLTQIRDDRFGILIALIAKREKSHRRQPSTRLDARPQYAVDVPVRKVL